MKTNFQCEALPSGQFESLFALPDADLAAKGIRRMVADIQPGFPCRVSLVDAAPGESVLLMPFTHHDVSSPYRAAGPVFVRENARTARLKINEIPIMLWHRLLSLRAYDEASMMVHAEVVAGSELEDAIHRLFARSEIRYLHIHNAKPGCFNCAVLRVA